LPLRHCLLVLLLAACAGHPPAAATDPATDPAPLWLLAPEPADDAVHASDTEATLRARYGAAHVTRARIPIGEGETAPGAVLFADDRGRRLSVIWGDSIRRAAPTSMSVMGAVTRWRVRPGVTLGTRLSELERLNGRPFELWGFEFDYAGTVYSWNGGRLDSAWATPSEEGAQHVVLRLMPDSDASPQLQTQVAGEQLFSSAHPAMRALDPRVFELSVAPR